MTAIVYIAQGVRNLAIDIPSRVCQPGRASKDQAQAAACSRLVSPNKETLLITW